MVEVGSWRTVNGNSISRLTRRAFVDRPVKGMFLHLSSCRRTGTFRPMRCDFNFTPSVSISTESKVNPLGLIEGLDGREEAALTGLEGPTVLSEETENKSGDIPALALGETLRCQEKRQRGPGCTLDEDCYASEVEETEEHVVESLKRGRQ